MNTIVNFLRFPFFGQAPWVDITALGSIEADFAAEHAQDWMKNSTSSIMTEEELRHAELIAEKLAAKGYDLGQIFNH